MADFEEKSGVVSCNTPWGKWLQNIEEVFIEIPVAEGTNSKEISIVIKPKSVKVVVKGKEIFSVNI